MSLTVGDALAQARHHLMTAKPDSLNQLESAISAGATTFTLKHPIPASSITPGTTLAIDLEEFYVVNVQQQEITVIPGMNGSVSSDHATDALVYIAPAFSPFRVATYINEALEDLSSGDGGLFRMKEFEFTYTPSVAGYNIDASDMIDVWRVRFDIPGPSRLWPELSRQDWQLDQHASTTDFPNAKQLVLRRGGFPGHVVRVDYKAGFSPLFDFSTFDPSTDYSDSIQTVTGLHPEAHSILPKMSALTLQLGREIKRTLLNRQPEPRRQEEVPVGGASQSLRPLLQSVQDDINRERTRLKRRFPERAY